MAFDSLALQNPMNPEPVQSSFLNDDRFDLHAVALLGLLPRPRKKLKQAGLIVDPGTRVIQ